MKQAISGLFLSIVFLLILLPFLLIVSHRSANEGIPVRLYLTAENKIITIELEEYIKGVVAAEMPADFHLEALKAQAVAARTVTIKRLKRFGGRGYPGKSNADLSDDFRDGQAWLGKKELRKKWGFWGFNKNWGKISQAVEETKDIIITYQGRPIDAVYHSTSGPRTENAKDLWGIDFPYLRSVECPYGKHSRRYTEVKTIPIKDFVEKLGLSGDLPVSSGSDFIKVTALTSGGRAKSLYVGGKIFRGEDFRLKLGLNSSNFQYQVSGDSVRFQTIGYGHGVGMCQYGADGMAREGKNFHRILTYYYQGVELRRVK